MYRYVVEHNEDGFYRVVDPFSHKVVSDPYRDREEAEMLAVNMAILESGETTQEFTDE